MSPSEVLGEQRKDQPVSKEKRSALRIALNAPTLVEPIGMPKVQLHENLAKVYERVAPSEEFVGKKIPGVLRDLSTNGAFIACQALPLLSRVAISFSLEGFGQVEALGWSLWRRSENCSVPRSDGSSVELPAGFGVLFEAIPLDARIAIHKAVSGTTKN
jgi:hypothetical protein